jgi:hypothetical protein
MNRRTGRQEGVNGSRIRDLYDQSFLEIISKFTEPESICTAALFSQLSIVYTVSSGLPIRRSTANVRDKGMQARLIARKMLAGSTLLEWFSFLEEKRAPDKRLLTHHLPKAGVYDPWFVFPFPIWITMWWTCPALWRSTIR